ncbi:DUF4145 domain-containing protein [Pseudomonas sp. V98_8]|uniref:DUF4145 domain-containing protein n=1 Tax=Pseudomonas sp. V98_8 TaxID=3044228 RepID=UPI00249E1139|nr:DUF4145 domain-containing protein [Pseudomonas sp. V98_8]MDI3391412.1 DUF4145 domain-containing protein [Pseudomonas sp. V98_8]
MGERSQEYKLENPDELLHKIECRQCCRETNHKVIASYVESGSDESDSRNHYYWTETSQIIQCVGCELVSFRTIASNSEDYEYDVDGRYPYETVKFYPGRSTGLKGIDRNLIPYRIAQLYQEAKTAVENDLSIIGGIGIRAILDAVCKEVKAAGDNLYQQIDDLHKKSLVTKEGAAALHKIRLLGNKAAHEAEAHSRDQLLLALEIVEYILTGTYVMPERVKLTFIERPKNPFSLPPALPNGQLPVEPDVL